MKLGLNLFVLCLLVASLAACRQAEQKQSEPNYTWDEYIATLETDDVGSYRVVSANAIESDSGFTLGVEARFYPELKKTRFVVTQDDLALQAQAIGIEDMRFLVHQGDKVLVTQDFNSSPLATQNLSENLFVTDLYDLRPLRNDSSSEVCAVLELTYEDELYFPINLSACNNYIPSSS